MPRPQTLGERIAQARREKAVREARDIAASEVADAVGVTPANYSRWESGERVPREDALAKLAYYLGVTPAYLRYGVQVSEPSIVDRLQNDRTSGRERTVADGLAALAKKRPASKKRANGEGKAG